MNDEHATLQDIQHSAARMQAARRRAAFSPLRGLGVLGVIGWSIALPAVAGAVLGLWLERRFPQAFSWPLALLLGGLVIGILVAWEWIAREQRQLQAAASTPPPAQGPHEESRDLGRDPDRDPD